MCDWWLGCAELFQPLVEALMAITEVLASKVIHIDDTRGRYSRCPPEAAVPGHFWVWIGDAEHPLVVFDYTPNRSRDGPEQLLGGYRGYVQADAYSGYDGVYLESDGQILEVACWAHARRKCSIGAQPRCVGLQVMLARIGQLYKLEKQLRQQCADDWCELPADERYALVAAGRQAEARPLLEKLSPPWLEAEASPCVAAAKRRGRYDGVLSESLDRLLPLHGRRPDWTSTTTRRKREMRATSPSAAKTGCSAVARYAARAMAIHFSPDCPPAVATAASPGRISAICWIRLPRSGIEGHLSRRNIFRRCCRISGSRPSPCVAGALAGPPPPWIRRTLTFEVT